MRTILPGYQEGVEGPFSFFEVLEDPGSIRETELGGGEGGILYNLSVRTSCTTLTQPISCNKVYRTPTITENGGRVVYKLDVS